MNTIQPIHHIFSLIKIPIDYISSITYKSSVTFIVIRELLLTCNLYDRFIDFHNVYYTDVTKIE